MRQDAVTFVFSGRFHPTSFVEFARNRAARLSLKATSIEPGSDRISVTVTGQADLIDAFEMACSLGPIDCSVEDVVRGGDQVP